MDQQKAFEDSHIFALAQWCVARISNPKEKVPDNLKSIMMMLADKSPKANSIFMANFGGVNERTMVRWKKERRLASEFGLEMLDCSQESLNNSFYDLMKPIQILADGPLVFSMCYDETIVPKHLEISPYGAIVGQVFPNQSVTTDTSSYASLRAQLDQLKEVPGLKLAELIKAYVITLQNPPKNISPLWIWKIIPTAKNLVKELDKQFPIENFIKAISIVSTKLSMVYLGEAGDGAFGDRIQSELDAFLQGNRNTIAQQDVNHATKNLYGQLVTGAQVTLLGIYSIADNECRVT